MQNFKCLKVYNNEFHSNDKRLRNYLQKKEKYQEMVNKNSCIIKAIIAIVTLVLNE